MQRLLHFLIQYHATLLYLLLVGICLVLISANNNFQRSVLVGTQKATVGAVFNQFDKTGNYFHLQTINDSLASENARLHAQLEKAQEIDTAFIYSLTDSVTKQCYNYIAAKVISNMTDRRDNYITLNRGFKHGIKKRMGVIGPNGIVGVVKNVSENYSSVISLLNTSEHFNVWGKLAESNSMGKVKWDKKLPTIASFTEVPASVIVQQYENIVTTGFSNFYPAGYPIGQVKTHETKPNAAYQNIEIQLATDFSSLEYVYVVEDIFREEKDSLKNLSQLN